MVVASVEGLDRKRVEAEAKHYLMIYSQDGPTTLKEIKSKK